MPPIWIVNTESSIISSSKYAIKVVSFVTVRFKGFVVLPLLHSLNIQPLLDIALMFINVPALYVP
jgi:hypothetical protein